MLSHVEKLELFLNRLQYAKFIFVLCIGIIDIHLILMFLSGSHNNNQQLMNLLNFFILTGSKSGYIYSTYHVGNKDLSARKEI
jgi:hypothetical protein